jgi:maleate cis-trans isomerase
MSPSWSVGRQVPLREKKLKVILVVPATNTTMEAEVRALWPEIDELHRVGIPRPMRPIVASDLPEYREHTLKAVEPYQTIGADMVIYGCTTAGFLAGPEGDADMQQALVRAVAAPAVTTASSMVDAMRRAGVSRPAIVTPYLKPSNDGLINFLLAKGVKVSTLDSFFFTTTEQYDQVTSEQVLALAELTGRDPSADCLFIACTQLPTLSILEELRRRLNKPVLGAIQATVANAKRVLALGLIESR